MVWATDDSGLRCNEGAVVAIDIAFVVVAVGNEGPTALAIGNDMMIVLCFLLCYFVVVLCIAEAAA